MTQVSQMSQPQPAVSNRHPLCLRPRVRRAALAAACAAVLASLGGPIVAPQLPAHTAAAQQVQADDELTELVDDFYHAAAIANYPAARQYGQQLLDSNPDPAAVLDAFRTVHDRRQMVGYTLDERFLLWQQIDALEGVIGPVVELVNEGRRTRATDPEYIREQIERLNGGTIAFRNAVNNLRNSGEYAVPTMLVYLGDPDRSALHADIRRALRELGLPALSPLLAATSMDDSQLLAQVIRVLGDLGYPQAIPYILEQQERNSGQQVQQAATQALSRLGYSGNSSAATEYRRLAEQFWRREAPIVPDPRFPGANIWRWTGQGLEATNVPAQIFDEIMAMRTAGNTLALAGDNTSQQVQDEALALWLAANYRRESELEPDQQDPTRPQDAPSAGYYGTQAGVPYLQAVIARTDAERNLPPESRYDSAEVALRAITSLQEIIGQSTLQGGETPLSRAMNFPDRRVRIEAAIALAQALPNRAVTGSEQVVPLLAEALSQTGEPTVLLLMSNRDQLNTVQESLAENDFRAYSATSSTEAAEQAQALPGVDVLVIDTEIGDAEVNEILNVARTNPKLSGSAKLLIAPSGSRFATLRDSDPTVAITDSRDGAGLSSAIADAREQVGGLPIDEGGATSLATRAGELLKEIGLGSSVFNLERAEQQLLATLDDERVAIQVLAADIVSLLDGSEPQRALLQKATDPDTVEEVQIAAFNALAESAKRGGNQLSGDEVQTLLEAARSAESLQVRAAAAEAVGALSLPVDQARTLIITDTQASEVR